MHLQGYPFLWVFGVLWPLTKRPEASPNARRRGLKHCAPLFICPFTIFYLLCLSASSALLTKYLQLIQEERIRRCLTLQDRHLREPGQLQLNCLPLRRSTALQFIRRPHRFLLAGIFLGVFIFPESVAWMRQLISPHSGYFPLHEEQNRVYRPHPFELDASKARIKSIERAGTSTSPPTESTISIQPAMGAIPSITVPASMMENPTRLAPPNATSLPKSEFESRSNTPVASYNPTGGQDNLLPMGKYYPSNYHKRKEEKRSRQQPQSLRPPTSSPVSPTGSKSETQVPTTRDVPAMGHARNESEAKRRLQQYQRDMIAQATLALNGGNMSAATLSSLRTIGFTSMSNNPSKPKLAPLGSPGPVTPMDLEGAQDGYLGARGPTDAHVEEIARAIRADEERKRREGTTSPAVELGPSTF